MPKKKSSTTKLLTKDHFDQALSKGFSNFREEIDSVITFRLGMQKDEIMREVKDVITENNSVIFERIDPILAEVENARIDREMTTQKFEEHEKRLQKLETS